MHANYFLPQQEYISALQINAAGQVTCSELGLPNTSFECSTCGTKKRNFCEGVYGYLTRKLVLGFTRVDRCNLIRQDTETQTYISIYIEFQAILELSNFLFRYSTLIFSLRFQQFWTKFALHVSLSGKKHGLALRSGSSFKYI